MSFRIGRYTKTDATTLYRRISARILFQAAKDFKAGDQEAGDWLAWDCVSAATS